MKDIKEMVSTIYHALEEKKGEEIEMIDVSEIFSFADYFVITNGNSGNQITALVEEVESKMNEKGYVLKAREGYDSQTWTLLDYGDVIVHIFDRESRNYYGLERLWMDGKKVEADSL